MAQGEVYKARDTRLDRTVALKILPADLASDPERRQRFEREAKTISQLSHPHICTLHDVGTHEGATFLVMEHLAGETLAERLKQGPLPLAQALDIAAQIADALAAAHKQGVIHRDLKPGNVMVTQAGTKLLDFGLAKLKGHGEQPALDEAASMPTATDPLTARGTIVGTLPYMAPEQLEGKPADARTDLWALGTILYEMVSGTRAFEGSSSVSLIGHIMNTEPPALATRQPLTPPALEHVVRKCLAKQAEDRWASARDVADELRWISQTGTAAVIAAAPRRGVAWRTVALVTALVALGSMATTTVLWRLRPTTLPAPVVRSLVGVDPADELNTGGVSPTSWMPTAGGSRTALAWTPDGRALVFAGRKGGVQQLYVRELERDEARPLAGTEGAQVPVVSPDGAWVAFWSRRAIRKVALTGGPPVVLCEGVRLPPAGMSWGTTGRLVFTDGMFDVLRQVSSEGGAPTAPTKLLPDERSHALPQLLPGDAAALFTVRRYEWIWSQDEVVAQILATGERKALLRDAVDARYVPSGHLVFLRQGVLMAVPFDLARLEVRGSPVPLFDGVAQALTAGNANDVTGAGQFAVAPTGALAYVAGPVVPYPDHTVAAVDRHGEARPLPMPARSYASVVRVSPDRRRLALIVQSALEQSIWLYDVARSTLTKLTPGGEADWYQWTPDGQRLAFTWTGSGGLPQLFWQRADGNGAPEVLVKEALYPPSWSKDGRELLALKSEGIWLLSLSGAAPTLRPLIQTSATEQAPEFSPDGRAVAYELNESGRWEVYVQPYPGSGPRIQVSADGGTNAAWNPKGEELFFVRPSDPSRGEPRRLMVVDVRTHPVLDAGRSRALFDIPSGNWAWACGPIRCYDVAPDGQGFFVVGPPGEPPPPRPPVTHINLILNWFEELKAKVPVTK